MLKIHDVNACVPAYTVVVAVSPYFTSCNKAFTLQQTVSHHE